MVMFHSKLLVITISGIYCVHVPALGHTEDGRNQVMDSVMGRDQIISSKTTCWDLQMYKVT